MLASHGGCLSRSPQSLLSLVDEVECLGVLLLPLFTSHAVMPRHLALNTPFSLAIKVLASEVVHVRIWDKLEVAVREWTAHNSICVHSVHGLLSHLLTVLAHDVLFPQNFKFLVCSVWQVLFEEVLGKQFTAILNGAFEHEFSTIHFFFEMQGDTTLVHTSHAALIHEHRVHLWHL